jgi:hypothetical protein
MSQFFLPKGQPLRGGSMFLRPGTIVSDASGSFKVISCPDVGSNVGELLPVGWVVPKDAIPANQQSYDLMRALYANREIVTHDDAKANIVRTPDL